MIRSFKFRIYPTKEQQNKLWEYSSIFVDVYNYFLTMQIENYNSGNKYINRCEMQKRLTALKQNNLELYELSADSLQAVVHKLDDSYHSFFNSRKVGIKANPPRFHPKTRYFGMQFVRHGYKLRKNNLDTVKFGKIKVNQHRKLSGNIKRTYISRNEQNQWFVIICTEHVREQRPLINFIGIDIGCTNMVATSEGELFPNIKDGRYFDKQIFKLKGRMLKCTVGSRRYKFLHKKVGKLYGAKGRKIKDFHHKLSNQLSIKYDMIYCENLKLQKMLNTTASISKKLKNAAIFQFITLLSYKTNIIKVNAFNTSLSCNKCGNIKANHSKGILYKCRCGYIEHRDVNAAKNIFCLGQANSQGCTVSLREVLSR